jgi:hypothetical protein
MNEMKSALNEYKGLRLIKKMRTITERSLRETDLLT